MVFAHSLAQFPDKLLTHFDPNVRLEQKHFEIFKELFVDCGAVEQAGDFAKDASSRFFETALKLGVWLGLTPEKTTKYHQEHLTNQGERKCQSACNCAENGRIGVYHPVLAALFESRP